MDDKLKLPIFIKIFLWILLSSVGPIIIIGLYELIIYHQVVYGESHPLMFVLSSTVLLSIIVAGFVAKDIIKPVEILLNSVQNYRTQKSQPKFSIKEKDSFGHEFYYLFHEFEKMIHEIEVEQTAKAHLAAIGMTTAMIAHDVRKPLANMKVLLQTLPIIKDDEQKVRQIAAKVDKNISQVTSMLSEILDYARDDSVLDKGDADIVSIITLALSDAIRRYPTLHVKLKYVFKHNNMLINVDANRIARIFTNIIDNAFNATIDGGNFSQKFLQISIQTSLEETNSGKFMVIKIANNGPKIPANILPHIFEPFVSGNKDGSGIGMAICHKIVDLHGGAITARNLDNADGVEFSISLPTADKISEITHHELIYDSNELKLFREEEDARKDITTYENTATFCELNKKRGRISHVLIVDDEPIYSESLRNVVNNLHSVKDHIKIVAAFNTEKAIEILETQQVDYVILDLDLGNNNMDGYQLLKFICNGSPDIYTVISSNKRDSQTDTKIRELSFDKFLGFAPKPISNSDFLQLIACKKFEPINKTRNKKKKILLVNDDECFNISFKLDLSSYNMEVVDVLSVANAIEQLTSMQFDAIMSDINLGNNTPSGYDLLKTVRENDSNIPFIMMSGYARDSEWPKAKKLGGSAYLQLPFNKSELENLLSLAGLYYE